MVTKVMITQALTQASTLKETEGNSDDYEYEYEEVPKAPTTINQPTMAERSCNATSIPLIPNLPGINNSTNAATCTLINKCSAMVDNPQAPSTLRI